MSAAPASAASAASTSRKPGAPCPNANIWRTSCKRRLCPVCGPRWARDWFKVLTGNLSIFGRDVVMVAITPPGEDVLPWDDTACDHSRGGRHNGKRGCRVQGRSARMWNETASWRYAGLRRAAAAYTRRHASEPVNLLGRVWEPQKRGVLHAHLLLAASTPAELEAAGVFVGALKRLAPEYGFGFVDARGKRRKGEPGRLVVAGGEVLKIVKPTDAARYLAAYLTGRSPHKPSIRHTIADPALSAFVTPRQSIPVVWLTPRLTAVTRGGSGITMRTLRRARHLWSWVKGVAEEGPKWTGPDEAAIVGAVFRRVFQREADDEPPPLERALELAATAQARYESIPAGFDRMTQRDALAAFADSLALTLAGLDRPSAGRLDLAAAA